MSLQAFDEWVRDLAQAPDPRARIAASPDHAVMLEFAANVRASANPVTQLVLDDLDEDDLRTLAARIAQYLPAAEPATADRWMPTADAAEYLGMTANALHKHTSARSIPFSQDVPGGRCYFKRSDLDAWREGRA